MVVAIGIVVDCVSVSASASASRSASGSVSGSVSGSTSGSLVDVMLRADVVATPALPVTEMSAQLRNSSPQPAVDDSIKDDAEPQVPQYAGPHQASTFQPSDRKCAQWQAVDSPPGTQLFAVRQSHCNVQDEHCKFAGIL